MCYEELGCWFSVSSTQVPLVGFEENVAPFVSPYVVVALGVRQVSILVVAAVVVWWS